MLKLYDKDDLAAGRRAAVMLASAPSPPSSSATAAVRTLLNIIRDDQQPPPTMLGATAGDPILICHAVSLPALSMTASPPASAFTPVEATPSSAPPIIPGRHTAREEPIVGDEGSG